MRLRDIWSDIWNDFELLLIEWKVNFKIRFNLKEEESIVKTINRLIFYTIPILLIITIVLLVTSQKIEETTIIYNITEAMPQNMPSAAVEQKTTDTLGKAIKETIHNECVRQKVDENLVYAIINSPLPTEDAFTRSGIMKIHPDLVDKYNKQESGPGVLESIYSNAVAGIGRLAWALENNNTLDGTLMVYIYTKPQAQEMWSKGTKTTKWVESVKEELK